MQAFLKESQSHGWPSFRDDEVNWEYVRCLRDGECVSTTGTHLVRIVLGRRGMFGYRRIGMLVLVTFFVFCVCE